ncbi:GNAT family N-acetyltransferase [Halomicroarcula limicola]|uniref:GNAT family N-acetyltransferase n=1 Tax=Haloarcula limicola TaxID=1429915 RepID=A0A8J8C555_9EURY|nr:GNAT family N-acetyltransferase [Halomicroarcula limicola]MBV0925962.1 GNAT family N-acetyltransferase [Halomicroarcula limicola]
MEAEIRQAEREDGDELIELWHGFTEHLSKYDDRYKHKDEAGDRWLQYFENQLLDSKYGTVFVAEADEQLVGVLEVRVVGDHPIFRLKDHGYINGHFVKDEYRQSGLGQQLLEAAADWLRDHPRGIEFCRVDVIEGDEDGMSVYEDLDFEPIEHVYEYEL